MLELVELVILLCGLRFNISSPSRLTTARLRTPFGLLHKYMRGLDKQAVQSNVGHPPRHWYFCFLRRIQCTVYSETNQTSSPRFTASSTSQSSNRPTSIENL